MANVAVLDNRRAGRARFSGRGYAIAVREARAMWEAGEVTAGQFLALCTEAANAEALGEL